MRYLITTIFSFEASFVLFLFGGRYKNDPQFSWLPVDITVLFLLVSVATGVWVLYKRHFYFHRDSLILTGLFATFLAYSGLSYFWSPSSTYAVEKIGYLWVLTLWPFLACTIIISQDTARLRRFFFALLLLSSWILAESIGAFVGVATVGQQVDALGARYLGLGRVIGPGALILIAYAIAIVRSRKGRLLCFVGFAGYMATLLILGGRGPFLAASIPLLIPLFYGIRPYLRKGQIYIRKYAKPMLTAIIAGVVLGVMFASSEIFTTFARLLPLLAGEIGDSASARMQMYSQALDIWAEHPIFGAGIGGWPVLSGWGDQRMYPHNMILEVLSEFGIVGLALWGLPFAYALYKFIHRHIVGQDMWKILVLMVFANTMINAMLSGDITDNRIVFAAMGLCLYRSQETGGTSVRVFNHRVLHNE